MDDKSSHKKLWWDTMLKKHGSVERVRQIMGEGGQVGGLAKGRKGLAAVSDEKLAEIVMKGVAARKAKKDRINVSQD